MFEIVTRRPEGWVNTWLYPDEEGRMTPETFNEKTEAEAALAEFFADMDEEIARGQRGLGEGPWRCDLRIQPVAEGGS